MNAEAAANWAAVVVTLGIAIVGWYRSNKASRRAEEADAHAAEAIELARSAEARADRLERIQVEPRHVVWEHQERDNLGERIRVGVSYVNAGTDPAHDVHLVADLPGYPRQEARFATVKPTQRIGLNLASIVAEEHEQQRAVYDRNPGFIGVPTAHVRLRITWRSELGVPHSEDLGEIAL